VLQVEETHGVIVNVRGSYWDPAGPPLPPGERKLYLEILAPDEVHLSRAKNELRRILEAETARANLHALTQGIAAPNQATQGRYSVV
jgi:ATP-dependent RNA helicase DDX46/PRP5